jgi:hypothetical protein
MGGLALAAVLSGLALPAPASADGLAHTGAPYSRPVHQISRAPYPVNTPMCNRAAVRQCQADASFAMKMCDPFPGRLACADRILTELSACWAATGCF